MVVGVILTGAAVMVWTFLLPALRGPVERPKWRSFRLPGRAVGGWHAELMGSRRALQQRLITRSVPRLIFRWSINASSSGSKETSQGYYVHSRATRLARTHTRSHRYCYRLFLAQVRIIFLGSRVSPLKPLFLVDEWKAFFQDAAPSWSAFPLKSGSNAA